MSDERINFLDQIGWGYDKSEEHGFLNKDGKIISLKENVMKYMKH